MNKLLVCQLDTLLCGLLAISVFTRLDSTTGHLHNSKQIGEVLGLLSGIFATQWIEYQKRQDVDSTHPGWPVWVRRLLC